MTVFSFYGVVFCGLLSIKANIRVSRHSHDPLWGLHDMLSLLTHSMSHFCCDKRPMKCHNRARLFQVFHLKMLVLVIFCTFFVNLDSCLVVICCLVCTSGLLEHIGRKEVTESTTTLFNCMAFCNLVPNQYFAQTIRKLLQSWLSCQFCQFSKMFSLVQKLLFWKS